MDNINIVDQIKSMMPFEFVELDKICDRARCDNKITGVKYPDEQPRLMDHHNVKSVFRENEYYPVKLTMCTPCMLKEDHKKDKLAIHYGTVKMMDYNNKMKGKAL